MRTPIPWQDIVVQGLQADGLGQMGGYQYVAGPQGLILHQHLQQRQRSTFSGIDYRLANPVPSTAIQPGSFARKCLVGKAAGCDAPHKARYCHQANTPCSMRPKVFDTANEPSSVSRSDRGLLPPKAALGFLSQLRAACSSSNTSTARSITCAKRTIFPDSSELKTPSFLRRASVRSGISSARDNSDCPMPITRTTASTDPAEMPWRTNAIHSR